MRGFCLQHWLDCGFLNVKISCTQEKEAQLERVWYSNTSQVRKRKKGKTCEATAGEILIYRQDVIWGCGSYLKGKRGC